MIKNKKRILVYLILMVLVILSIFIFNRIKNDPGVQYVNEFIKALQKNDTLLLKNEYASRYKGREKLFIKRCFEIKTKIGEIDEYENAHLRLRLFGRNDEYNMTYKIKFDNGKYWAFIRLKSLNEKTYKISEIDIERRDNANDKSYHFREKSEDFK